MGDELHDDIREIRSMITQNLAKTVSIERALWPDPGQPSVLTKHSKRIEKLENWRTWLSGAWAVVSAVFTYHFVHGRSK